MPGMRDTDVQTPCLVLDLDALEYNIKKMGDYAKAHRVRHRAHGKMHKSIDVAKLQERSAGAVSICCQKVSAKLKCSRAAASRISSFPTELRDPLWSSTGSRKIPQARRAHHRVCRRYPNVTELSVAGGKETAPRSSASSRLTVVLAAAACPRRGK